MQRFCYLIGAVLAGTMFFCNFVFAYTGSTVADGVKLYLTPASNEADIVFDFPANYPVNVIETRGEWVRVKDYLRLCGWVKKDELTRERNLIVVRSKIILRSGPGTGHGMVAKLYQGQILQYLGETRTWYKVKVIDPPDGGEGWVKKALVWG